MAEAHRKNQRRPHVGIEDRTPFPEVQSGPCGRLSHLKIVEKPMKTQWNVQCIIMLIWEYPTYGSLVWHWCGYIWYFGMSLRLVCASKVTKHEEKRYPFACSKRKKHIPKLRLPTLCLILKCIAYRFPTNKPSVSSSDSLPSMFPHLSTNSINPSEPQPPPRYRMPSIEQMMSSLSICVQVQLDHSNPT